MNIWVYAIAKDESQFADRWLSSMEEADGIAVLDTGSGDNTVELLEKGLSERGMQYVLKQKVISPWRFDVARNESMKLVPRSAELLLCTDLDEVLRPGWRAALEKAWRPGCTTARYEYVWSFRPDGSDGVKFLYEKAHIPGACRWVHPVHEVLEYDVPKRYCDVPGMRLEHHADAAKSRAGYLPLLELSVREAPEDDRNMHYLGREYMFRGMWSQAVETLKRHLALPGARWEPERAASMRYIAACCGAMGRPEEQELWLHRAALEAPKLREGWLELGKLYYEQQDFRRCVKALSRCLDIKKRELSYISMPEAWGALPWDMISVAWWHLGQREYAANCARQALRYGEDERIEKNLALFESAQG